MREQLLRMMDRWRRADGTDGPECNGNGLNAVMNAIVYEAARGHITHDVASGLLDEARRRVAARVDYHAA